METFVIVLSVAFFLDAFWRRAGTMRVVDLIAAERRIELVRLAQRAVVLVEVDDVEFAILFALGEVLAVLDDGEVVESFQSPSYVILFDRVSRARASMADDKDFRLQRQLNRCGKEDQRQPLHDSPRDQPSLFHYSKVSSSFLFLLCC